MRTRWQWFVVGVAALAVAAAGWLFVENQELSRKLEAMGRDSHTDPWKVASRTATTDPMPGLMRPAATIAAAATSATAPALPPPPREGKMQRRSRITDEIAAMLGRWDGETDDEYRARVMPMITAFMEKRRKNAHNMRRIAEEKAGITPEQSAQIDQALSGVYDDVISYTNQAVADGQISPYERNVTGMLEYAGGLGAILGGVDTKLNKVLSPQQRRAMHDAGFEWGEYLGFLAPWEKLNPPPARSSGG